MIQSAYTRLQIPEITIGSVKIGGENPIALQSMTNTNTNDTETSVEQCIRVFEAGGDYVRLTAQGIKEAENLKNIKQQLVARGYTQPLVADIHFNPQAALVAAKYVEKVRINPGNYVYIGSLRKTDYTDEEYAAELEKIRENILPLLEVCKQYGTAIRIGVNHGSLSQRIVSRYGDTPQGMVVSMMEFLHICKDADFKNVACSIKASNTRIMVQATRLLSQRMIEEDCRFPIHLGVTEAGAGEDGRIKSAVGSGSLLLDGIGDTIRVSLTEAPESEIPVCKLIVDYRNEVFATPLHFEPIEDVRKAIDAYSLYQTTAVFGIGGDSVPMVFGSEHTKADWVWMGNFIQKDAVKIPVVSLQAYKKSERCVLQISETELDTLKTMELGSNTIILFDCKDIHVTYLTRKLYAMLAGRKNPVVLARSYDYADFATLQIRAAMDFGSLLLDGFLNGVMIQSSHFSENQLVDLSFAILQASRSRFEKTEYISCPSCGRTLYDIEKALVEVKSKTSHLKGLKIAVMGCIVNGPGEMSDADYGYMGAGKGTVNLYKKQTLVCRNIPETEAVQALIQLIKDNGDWREK
ncbi:MAG: (E)-4-hydroxy-3-methylbut-2-enyl-diphosphate synthase [Bacteroidales bacterium]|nr:(E)-4-hydroxy-3-methylbut-2-enyl-diphosphate synthase [Bacteroidales bacterium]